MRDGGFVRVDEVRHLGTTDAPFSLALWVRPDVDAKTLVNLAAQPGGVRDRNGWCFPVLGFDGEGRLVGQVLFGLAPNLFLVARGPRLSEHDWSHVALTWAPASGVRLYVNGAAVGSHVPATAAERHYLAAREPVYLSYGSDHGLRCWSNVIDRGDFAGSLGRSCSTYDYELTPQQVSRNSRDETNEADVRSNPSTHR